MIGMLSIYVGLVLHLLAITSGAEIKSAEDGKAAVKLEIEDDRAKRASEGEGARPERQSVELPQDYYNLLQRLNAQEQPQRQQVPLSAQQPQQQSAGPRYFLSPDGNIYPEGHPALAQYETTLSQGQLNSGLGQPQQYQQTLGGPAYLQSPLDQTSPQTLPQSPPQDIPPGATPRISEFARQQQRLLQEYRDAPIRAQIAGFARGPQPPRPAQPVPTGPNSQSAQIFTPANGQNQGQQPVIPPQYQDPQNPGFVYSGVPVDSQAYLQQQYAQLPQQQFGHFPQQYAQQPQQQYAQLPQQQFAQIPQQQYAHLPQQQFAQLPQQQYAQLPQQQFAQLPQQQYAHLPQQQFTQQPQQPFAHLPQQQYVSQQYGPDGNQVFVQSTPRSPLSQPLYYPQAVAAQEKVRGSPNGIQPQFAPQQYFIENGRQSSGQVQFAPQDYESQVQYLQQPIQQQQPQSKQVRPQSGVNQGNGGRGYNNPSKPPSRSSIFVSRSSIPKSLSLSVTDGVSSEKVPVIRHPSPAERGYTQQDLNDLVRTGYGISPTQDSQYIKLKRQPQSPSEEGTNHVHYENPQDGVQYQYSPGTLDSRITVKTKKSVSDSEEVKRN